MALFVTSAALVAAQRDETIHQAQNKLKELGYDPGPIDGRWGRKTEAAIKSFQRDKGLPVTGELDQQTKERLGLLITNEPTSTRNEPSALTIPDRLIGTWVELDKNAEVLSRLVIKSDTILWTRKEEGEEVINARQYTLIGGGDSIVFPSRVFIAKGVFFGRKVLGDTEVKIMLEGDTIILETGRALAGANFTEGLLEFASGAGVYADTGIMYASPQRHVYVRQGQSQNP
jgi:peptidoglycan hydrolase-like protein with peptidoglycan-binding domain